tara:strand:+ start:785 stop:1051 length:267 start_codon:yes stop_codon:yes gene_type:complete
MPKIEKFVVQTDWLWYEAEITEEQAEEYRQYENLETDTPVINNENLNEKKGVDLDNMRDEPDWLYDLDYDLVRDKPASDETSFELIEE